MVRIPDPDNNRDDKIAFILSHRLGSTFDLVKRHGPLLLSRPGDKVPDISEGLRSEKALSDMNEDELDAEYRIAQSEVAAAQKARLERESAERKRQEARLPINRPADFGFWAKFPFWTVEEAVALVLERDPKHCNGEAVRTYMQISPTAQTFARTLELAKRAVAMSQLTDGTTPGAFLAWAKRYALPVPSELEAEVARYGAFIGDWKTLFDAAVVQRDNALEREKKLSEMLAQVRSEMEKLSSSASATAEMAKQVFNPPKEPDPREVDTLRRLCIGLAIGGYSYDPAERRSSVVPEMVGDLERLGLTVSDDTVRKHLRAGLAMLPQNWRDGWRKV